jgi:hypothetical protein
MTPPVYYSVFMSAHYAKEDQNEISTGRKKIKNSEINREMEKNRISD